MALLPYQAPSIFVDANNNEPGVFQAPVVSANVVFPNDISFFIPASSGLTAGATRGAAGGGGTYQYLQAGATTGGIGPQTSGVALSATLFCAGLAIHSSYSTFGGPALTTALTQAGEQQYPLFPTQVSTATTVNMLPSEPGNLHVNTLSGNLMEISLVNTVTWATNLIGSPVSVGLDYTGGQFFIVSNGGSQSITTSPFIIVGKPEGPGKGGIGDTGVRVLVSPNGALGQYFLVGQ